MTDLTYPEVGATRYEPLPAGYRHLHHRLLLGRGVLDQAGAAVLTFAMHRATGARVYTAADRAAPGVQLRVGVGPGPLSVPCEVVWTIDEPRRAGFGYGTRPGHQARGEEAFIVEQDDQGDVWFRVTAFSVPARLPMRLAGPGARVAQLAYAQLCGRALKRLCHRPR